MFSFLNKIIKVTDAINEWVGNNVAWLSSLLVVLICIDVVMRYFFNFSSAAVYELEWHLFAMIFLLAAGFTLKHDRHVRVDVFYTKFSDHQKAWVNLIGTIFLLMPLCVVVVDTSFKFVENAYLIQESSVDPGGLPSRYIIKSMITIGFSLLFLQALSTIAKSILTIAGRSEPLNS